MWDRRRRAAISQAKVRKECKLYGAFFGGHRAFRMGMPREANAYKGKERKAWQNGWDTAEDQRQEKENGSKKNNDNDNYL